MDLLKEQTPDNYDEVRGRKLSYSLNSSKDNSMDSMAFSRPYHEKMEQNNNMDVNDDNKAPSELSYEATQERDICLRMVAENYEDMLPSQGKLTNNNHLQHVPEMNTKSTPIWGSTTQNEESTFINIPLPYDSDALSDPETWSSNFYPVSLYSSIKYLASDIKNIKDSLKFMTKYITNKKIDSSKVNDFADFKDIGEAVWNFISSVYNSN